RPSNAYSSCPDDISRYGNTTITKPGQTTVWTIVSRTSCVRRERCSATRVLEIRLRSVRPQPHLRQLRLAELERLVKLRTLATVGEMYSLKRKSVSTMPSAWRCSVVEDSEKLSASRRNLRFTSFCGLALMRP